MNEILKGLTVLLVEDEDKIRINMVSAMENVFNKILSAQNGDEGIKKFKKYNPDFVITDISMPILDGLDMSKEIRKISKDTPIVVLSAFSEKEKLLKAIEIGIDKYIIKPIDMEELFTAISTLAQSKIGSTNIVEIGNGYSFNKLKRVFIKDKKEIPLTKKELAFISILIKRLGTLVLHEEIKNSVWVGEKVSDAAIRTFIKRIRDKIGSNLIKNVPGLGYKIETNF